MSHEGIAQDNANRAARERDAEEQFKKNGQYGGFGDKPSGRPLDQVPAYEVPKTYKAAGGGGPVAVDDMALKHFAAAIRAIRPHLVTALKDVESLDVRPGGFKHGQKIRELVVGGDGESGLKKSYVLSLTAIGESFDKLASGIDDLAGKYKTTEELNSKGSEDLQKLMSEFGNGMPKQVGP